MKVSRSARDSFHWSNNRIFTHFAFSLETQVLPPTYKPVHTVAEKCDCRRKQRDNGDSRTFLQQSHLSATVWTGLMPEADHGSFDVRRRRRMLTDCC